LEPVVVLEKFDFTR